MKNVYEFYKEKGWNYDKKITHDSKLFEDNRNVAKNYLKKCRYRIQRFIPKKGDNFLDFASGPIQYKEYLAYSKKFKYRHCVDFSKEAINKAKKKLGKKGKYYCNDIMKIKFKKNYFDCILSMHTIYHINKNKQKKVIEKLLSISKPGKPIIIVYSNPSPLIKKIYSIFYFKKKKPLIYFYCFPLKWWYQFNKVAEIDFYSWRSFSSQHQQKLVPNNLIGKIIFKILFFFEDNFNIFFSKYFQYPIIILKKKGI